MFLETVGTLCARRSRTPTSSSRSVADHPRTPITCPLTRLLLDKKLHEIQAQHAFIRDTSSKGRWDAALTRGLFGMMMEMFERCVARDLGRRVVGGSKVEHVC